MSEVPLYKTPNRPHGYGERGSSEGGDGQALLNTCAVVQCFMMSESLIFIVEAAHKATMNRGGRWVRLPNRLLSVPY